MKNYGLLVLLILFYQVSFTQAPSIKIFDKRFGGNNEDGFNTFIQTKDGGYLLGGASHSPISGDKTQQDWDPSLATDDQWIVKIDSLGNKQWDKRFGGLSDDFLSAVRQTNDGGYILIGYSESGIGGDKTQPAWGGGDYWLVKIDAAGDKQWDKRFGGNLTDYPSDVQQTKDSGYILAGSSNSPASGDKTQNNWDTTNQSSDYWIVKTDTSGNKQWDKRFGGTAQDGLCSILQTNDGGYLLGGLSNSGSNGDKTQPTWGGYGDSDYWVVKIDSAGNKQWDKDYGGTSYEQMNSMALTNDGGYILGGFSSSPISGDKTQPSWNGSDDYWIVKMDSVGNKQWDKDYGGTSGENLLHVEQTKDGGYLLSGISASDSGGDKTENNIGYTQIWLVKVDSSGNKQWDKTILNTGYNFGYAFQTTDSCYVIGTGTNAGVGGYKTQSNWDVTDSTDDYWIVKFCFTGIGEGVTAINTNLQFNVYPNPFVDELDITLAQQSLHQSTFTITNILGQTVYAQNETNLSPTYTKMLDLSYLPNGIYWVSVVVDGERVTREVVKQ